MRKKIEWQWEKLDEGTYRAKVIGGWLIMHVNQCIVNDSKKREMAISESMCFIADRDHEWTVIAPVQNTPVIPKPNDFEPPK